MSKKGIVIMTFSTERLQILVDEHAFFGMKRQEIIEHLILEHGIDKNSKFPIISKRATRARKEFLNTGKKPLWLTGEDLMKNDNFTKKSKPLTKEQFKDIESKVQIKEIDSSYTENTEVDFYQPSHPTSLDRWLFSKINAFEKQVLEVMDPTSPEILALSEYETPYQKFEYILKTISQDEKIKELNTLKSIIEASKEYGLSHEMLFYSNWFKNIKTKNIQINSNQIEELLTSKVAYNQNKWKKISSSNPVYIDISHNTNGQRYISGIASIPLNDGSVRFMATIEWKKIGFQGTIMWENDNLSKDSVLIYSHADSGICENDINNEYQEVAAISLRLYKTILNLEFLSELSVNNNIPKLPIDFESKKTKKKKLKGKSIFEFANKSLSMNIGRATHSSSSKMGWSLNHLVQVKGHFRAQKYGPELSMTKVIWISPYNKGKGSVDTMLDKHLMQRL